MRKMKSIMNFRKWDIVLVPFPFTNLTTTKKRPALIISPDDYNKNSDVVIAFITSKLDLERRVGDYKIKEWAKSNLPKPSMLRMKFATIDTSIIIKKIGKLTEKDCEEFVRILIKFFAQ